MPRIADPKPPGMTDEVDRVLRFMFLGHPPVVVLARNYQEYMFWVHLRAVNPSVAPLWARETGLRGLYEPIVIALEGWWMDKSDTEYLRVIKELVFTNARVVWDYT